MRQIIYNLHTSHLMLTASVCTHLIAALNTLTDGQHVQPQMRLPNIMHWTYIHKWVNSDYFLPQLVLTTRQLTITHQLINAFIDPR